MRDMRVIKEKSKMLGALISDVYKVFGNCVKEYTDNKTECTWMNIDDYDKDKYGYNTISYHMDKFDSAHRMFAVAVSDAMYYEKDRGDVCSIIKRCMPKYISLYIISDIIDKIDDTNIAIDYEELFCAFKRIIEWWDPYLTQSTLISFCTENTENVIKWRNENTNNTMNEIQAVENNIDTTLSKMQILKDKAKLFGAVLSKAHKILQNYNLHIANGSSCEYNSKLTQNITRDLTPAFQQFIVAVYDVIVDITDWNHQNSKYDMIDVYMPSRLDYDHYWNIICVITDVDMRVDYMDLCDCVKNVTHWRNNSAYKLNWFPRAYQERVAKWREQSENNITQTKLIKEITYEELPEPEDINCKAISNSSAYWIIKAIRKNQNADATAETDIIEHLKIVLANKSKGKRFYDDRNKVTDLGKRNLKVFLQELIDKLE